MTRGWGRSIAKGNGGPLGATATSPVIKVKRQATTRNLLTLHWDYPVHVADADAAERVAGRTYAKAVRRALPREQALAAIAGDDPRPLLVMRECGWCQGSDDALLSSRLDNEKTILLARWFHLVKLPNDVLADDHPFRNLFAVDSPPHLIVARRDGGGEIPLSGQQSQTELWEAMTRTLDTCYEGHPERALKKVYKLLDAFDRLDQQEARLRREFDDELEGHGPRSSKLKKLQKELDEAARERWDLQRDFDELLGASPVGGH